MKKSSLTDKEVLEYILGSLELIKEYLKGVTYKKFENDLKIQDSVCHRMYCIGNAVEFLSNQIKDNHPNFPWELYRYWVHFHNDPDTIWQLAKENEEIIDDFDSIYSLFCKLEEIYFFEFFPKKTPKVEKSKTQIAWSTDYKYPIKTEKSIWTVKKK
jgi:uncharacterized protein with HEPN domain